VCLQNVNKTLQHVHSENWKWTWLQIFPSPSPRPSPAVSIPSPIPFCSSSNTSPSPAKWTLIKSRLEYYTSASSRCFLRLGRKKILATPCIVNATFVFNRPLIFNGQQWDRSVWVGRKALRLATVRFFYRPGVRPVCRREFSIVEELKARVGNYWTSLEVRSKTFRSRVTKMA